jgi:hypothetical protein
LRTLKKGSRTRCRLRARVRLPGYRLAPDLVQNAIGDFLANLGPASAGAQLLTHGLQLRFDKYGGITAPAMTPASTDAGFVAEGAVIPVRQMLTGGVTLTPSKLKTISVFNREVFEHTTPNIEKVISATLSESVGLLVDSVMFGTLAATSTQPMGLRYGVAETTHESTASGTEAMIKDITNLASAVAGVAGNGEIILIAAPKTAVSLRLRALPDFPFEILSSSALTAGTVIAVAANALASAVDPAPTIEATRCRFSTAPRLARQQCRPRHQPRRFLTSTTAARRTSPRGGTRCSGSKAWSRTIAAFRGDFCSGEAIAAESWPLQHHDPLPNNARRPGYCALFDSGTPCNAERELQRDSICLPNRASRALGEHASKTSPC